jgi:hypothetical protein
MSIPNPIRDSCQLLLRSLTNAYLDRCLLYKTCTINDVGYLAGF